MIGSLAYFANLPILGSLGPSVDWELTYTNILRVMFLGTVALATWRFGVRGGLFAYLATMLIALPFAIEATEEVWRPHYLLELGIWVAIGGVFIWLIGREKMGRSLLEQSAEELERRAQKLSREITERKRAEAALRELDQMKSQFISNVSHELRTPLHSIMGFTKLILEGKVASPKDQREFLIIIDQQSKRLGKLIGELLDVSRLESGRFETQKQRLAIGEPIHAVIDELHNLASENGIVISAIIPVTLPKVEIDRERMMQVMTNLLGNAIKFSPSGGSITVKAQVKDSELLVQVGDNGTGIPKEVIPHVFEKFYRAKDSISVGGTGLGLYITKQIIEAHGGRIWVKSKPNKGATFYFTIPKPAEKKTKRIGEILVEEGIISPKDLEKVLNKQAGLEVEPSGD